MATSIIENANAPYYGYRGCTKIIPRATRVFGYYNTEGVPIMNIGEEITLFPEFSFNAFGQSFNLSASTEGRFWIECNSCKGYETSSSSGETYFEPYTIFLNTDISTTGYEATQSDVFSESTVEYFRCTTDYVKYIIKGSSYFNTLNPKESPSYYIEYLFKSDGVIQVKSSKTLTGVYMSLYSSEDSTRLLNDLTLEAGVSYVIKLSGSFDNPEVMLYPRAKIDYTEEYPVVGLLNIENPVISRTDKDTSYRYMKPQYRNLIYPRGVLDSSKVLRIKTPNGIGEMLLSSNPNTQIPHLGVHSNDTSYQVVDSEDNISEYVVRSSDFYSADNITLEYSTFYVSDYSTSRYWYDIPVEYLDVPVTEVTKLEILFKNFGGDSDYIPNSSYKDVYLCYASKHGVSSSSWKNTSYTLQKAYLGGCVELLTFTFNTPVTIAEFCVVPPPRPNKYTRSTIDSWCMHTKNNVLTNYAQNGAVRKIN